MTKLQGVPSDRVPEVLAHGETAARHVFVSLSGRHPEGRDADYIAWHSLDHRPEQYRLPELRHSIRLVSTPACRAVRAASVGRYDAVDHVMTYMFTDAGGIPGFSTLGGALDVAGRMPIRLPSIGYLTADLAGKAAAPRAVAGADVVPWRPALGVYLLIEQGRSPSQGLAELPGVAGVWWYHGVVAPQPYATDARDLQVTYCFLDGDPVETAAPLREAVQARQASGTVRPLLAAPFFAVVPFNWALHLPG